MAIRLVIFDCDGVLFHSDRANVAFYNAVLREAGEPPLEPDAEIAAHALASSELYKKYFADRPEALERVRQVSRGLDYGPFYPLMEPRQGLYDILRELRADYRIAMATNRSKTVHGVLDHFDLAPMFDLAVGALDVERPKPHPDMLLHCVDHFGLDAVDAVYVGDQPTDAQSADAAGMRFIGIGAIAAQSELSITELDELAAVLRTL